MKDYPIFYTQSMARLCARQGYLEKSAQIYRHLLEQDPDNEDLRKALYDVENSMQKNARKEGSCETNRLESLIETWVSLLVENNIRQKFDAIRRSIQRMKP